jgi:hypothetical protein
MQGLGAAVFGDEPSAELVVFVPPPRIGRMLTRVGGEVGEAQATGRPDGVGVGSLSRVLMETPSVKRRMPASSVANQRHRRLRDHPRSRLQGKKERNMQAGRAIPSTFTPEQVQAIERAYDLTCTGLGLSSAADQITEIVAETIIELARTGELDAGRLSHAAFARLRAKNC